MPFGDSEIKDAIFKKLDPWLNNVVDFHDVESAYKRRGELQAERISILRHIESVEDEILADENNKPRSNETRIKKLNATKKDRDYLATVEMEIANIENHCKLLEFKRDMFKSACYRMKIQWDM